MSRIHYPITSTIKYMSNTYERSINKDDVVSCYYCSELFPVFGNVVIPGSFECEKALRCPHCGKVVSVVYYYDRVIKKEDKTKVPTKKKPRKRIESELAESSVRIYVSEKSDSKRQMLYNQGLSDRQIARELKISKEAVIKWREKRGLLPHEEEES